MWSEVSEQDWHGITYTKIAPMNINMPLSRPTNVKQAVKYADPFQSFVMSLEPEDAMQLRPHEWEQIAES